MTHNEREELKSKGWEALADTTRSTDERKAGLLDVIRAHYERSIGNLTEKSRKQHGTLTEFVQSWLFANGDRVEEQDIVALLREEYPAPAEPRIRPGRSVWEFKT